MADEEDGSSVCPVCKSKVQLGDVRIECKGTCKGSFHATCVGIDRKVSKALIDNRNLKWQCDQCVNITSIAGYVAIGEENGVLQMLKDLMKLTKEQGVRIKELGEEVKALEMVREKEVPETVVEEVVKRPYKTD